MSIQLASTTDSAELVQAALGDKAEKIVEKVEAEKAEAKESAAEDISAETANESETLESESEDKPKKKTGFEKRISKLTKRTSVLKSEVEYWRSEAMKNQRPETPKEDTVKADNSKKPKADDFETHEAFLDALTDWKIEQRDAKQKEVEVKAKESELKTNFEKQREDYSKKVKEFAKSHDDFEEVMESVDDVTLSATVQQLLLKSGPDLSYALAKDKDELKRICALPAIEAALEIGRFESKLKPSESKIEKKASNAPAPVKPASGNAKSGSTKTIYDPDLSQADFERLREEQIGKRRRA